MTTPTIDPGTMPARARGIIKKQIAFSIVRFILLSLTIGAFLASQTILSSYLSLIDPSCSISACVWFQRRQFVLPLMFILIVGCVNDSVICSMWDIYTHDSVFATVAVQLFISAALFFALPLSMFSIFNIRNIPIIASPTSGYWTYVAPSFPILGFILTLALIYLAIKVWRDGPTGSWKRGVKDLHRTPTTHNRPHGWSVFGYVRSDDRDDTRLFIAEVMELSRNVFVWLRSGLKQTVCRHIDGVESMRFAITRNVVAIVLLVILAIYTVILCWGVINESFDTREMRAPFLGDYNYDNGILNMWSVYKNTIGRVNDTKGSWTQYSVTNDTYTGLSLESLLQSPSSCSSPTSFGLFGSTEGSNARLCHTRSNNTTTTLPFQGEVIYDMAMICNTSASFQLDRPGEMWLILPTGYTPTEVVEYFGTVFQYDPGVRLLPGFHLFGGIEITERRLIRKSLFEMIGFSPTYKVFPLLSLKWMNSVPLHNASIARATLSIGMPTAKTVLGDSPYSRVIQDVRTRTFLGVLPITAGLLALLQSIHVMLFGKRLLWGLFGSKFLDPFGLFGAYALKRQNKTMAGIYNNVDPNAIRLLNDTGLINLDPLVMGVDVYDGCALRLEGEEREESHSPPTESTVDIVEEVELRDVNRCAETSPLPSVDEG